MQLHLFYGEVAMQRGIRGFKGGVAFASITPQSVPPANAPLTVMFDRTCHELNLSQSSADHMGKSKPSTYLAAFGCPKTARKRQQALNSLELSA